MGRGGRGGEQGHPLAADARVPCVRARAVKKLLEENQLPHLLFYGPPGTGKTSTILAIARKMYGTSLGSMTLELNASDDRGIDVVRHEIQDFASTRTIFSNKFKLIILDECDAMTKDAQMALRRGERARKHAYSCRKQQQRVRRSTLARVWRASQ